MAHIPTNNTVLNDFFHALPQPTDTFLATYVWLGNCSKEVNMRSKVRTLYKRPTTIKDFPVWNYDGSSTGQAVTEDSEVWLKPVFFCLDPFSPITTSGGNSGRAPPQNYIVLCETVLPTPELIPTPDNFRRECERVHNTKEAQDENVWYGLEQEYILTIGSDSTHPLGWPNKDGSGMRPQGPYYCSVGTENAFGRQVSDAHYRACLYAGIQICGTNLEVFPGQLEYQVGPCEGVAIGDHLWISRYILLRVCELYGVNVTFDPKPIPGWSGSGLHTNFSTNSTRKEGGYDALLSYMPKFESKVKEHMEVYGNGNERRLVGAFETQKMDKFDFGVGSRASSIRIPRTTFNQKKGYAEDRRPASNADPYLVASRITKTCLDIE